MSAEPIDPNRPIFEDPPDGLGELDFHFGVFVTGMGSMVGIEVARAFAEAGDRLLEVALRKRESWEAAYPILFCYRHALELYLKAIVPEETKKSHGLDKLWITLEPHIEGSFRSDHIAWLKERIMEFHNIDPSSTAFRYYDTRPKGHPELWVDFSNLKHMVGTIFSALEHIRLRLF